MKGKRGGEQKEVMGRTEEGAGRGEQQEKGNGRKRREIWGRKNRDAGGESSDLSLIISH